MILILFLSYIFLFTDEDEETDKEGGRGDQTGSSSSRNSSSNRRYPGNKGLDKIYDDAGGNDPLSDSRLISSVNISTDEHSCSYDITYRGHNDRKVQCTSGCRRRIEPGVEPNEGEKFCEKYRYNDGEFDDGSLADTLLDQTYVSRRGSRRNRNDD